MMAIEILIVVSALCCDHVDPAGTYVCAQVNQTFEVIVSVTLHKAIRGESRCHIHIAWAETNCRY
jgi:predicted DNA-binding protein with PD1-like motif